MPPSSIKAMKAKGETAKAPLKESFSTWRKTGTIIAAMIGIAAGFTVIWYTAQFQTLYFLQSTALIDETSAKIYVGVALGSVAPMFVMFGKLSDRLGRKPVMLVGYGLTLILLFPAFQLLAQAANPQLVQASARAVTR